MFHLAVGGCALVLQKDLEYWGIDELMMEPCCALKYYPEIEICHNEKQVRAWVMPINRILAALVFSGSLQYHPLLLFRPLYYQISNGAVSHPWEPMKDVRARGVGPKPDVSKGGWMNLVPLICLIC